MNFSVFFKKRKYQVYQQAADYNNLLDKIQSVVEGIPDLFSISFIGPNDMTMSINNQEDLEALFHLGGEYRIANLQIKDLVEDMFGMSIQEEQPKEMQKEEVVEYREPVQQLNITPVPCNGCGSRVIVGIRYCCLDCQRFNLCSKCQQVVSHQHNLLKIRYAEQFDPKKRYFVNQPPTNPIFNPLFPNGGLFGQVNSRPVSEGIFSFAPPPLPNIPFSDKNLVENASLIEDLFGVEYEKAVIFVRQNSNLNKQQLVALAIKRRGY